MEDPTPKMVEQVVRVGAIINAIRRIDRATLKQFSENHAKEMASHPEYNNMLDGELTSQQRHEIMEDIIDLADKIYAFEKELAETSDAMDDFEKKIKDIMDGKA